MASPHFNTLRIEQVRRETTDCVSITFALPDHLRDAYQFTQGQHLTLRTHINGEELRRSYSICSSPHENTLTIAVKQIPKGKFSTYANQHLRTGDTIDVMTPMGSFFTPLHPEQHKRYVAFVAGSGITPVLSILKTTLQTEPNSHFTLFYGNKSFDHIIFREQLLHLKNQYLQRLAIHHILSRESVGIPLFKGHLSGEKCKRFANMLFNPATTDEVFLCGPAAMIDDITPALIDLGIDRRRIHTELFLAPDIAAKLPQTAPNPQEPQPDSFESRITIIMDGHTFDFDLDSEGESILNAAHEYGADVPYSCKGGVCCTCKAKVLEGKVKMDLNYSLEPDEVAAGYVLSCQSHPTSKRVVLTFDEN